MEAVNSAVRQAEGLKDSSSSTEGEESLEEAQPYGPEELVDVDREDDYVDEDRRTTVTVEAVDISREGISKAKADTEDITGPSSESGNKLNGRVIIEGKDATDPEIRQARIKKKMNGRSKKRKFRYESKAERKATRYKERSSGKAKAKARKT